MKRKKAFVSDIFKSSIFPIVSLLLFLVEVFFAKGNLLQIACIFFIIISGTVLPLVYFRSKRHSRSKLLFTVLSVIMHAAVFVCAILLFKNNGPELLWLFYFMNFAIFLGILPTDIVSMIYSAIKNKIATKQNKKSSNVHHPLYRFTAIIISVICVLCIYLLTPELSTFGDLFLLLFIPAFFSSVYCLFKANSNNPKLYFYSLLFSQLLIGMPTLIEQTNKLHVIFTKSYFDLGDIRMPAVYLSIVFLIIADAVQTFVLDKKNATNGTIEITA